ncbi:MAG: hypothetical protein ABL999_14325 [Pyrinomonadaceae bacterium]
MTSNRLVYRAIAIAAIFLAVTIWQTNVQAQMAGWIVWVKTSPCSGRMDWVSVGTQNPTGQGGSTYWETADRVVGGTNCGRLNSRCTKAEAEAEAATVRASPRFSDYCCKEYSIWRNSQTNKLSIVVGKFGTAGIGWLFEDGPMCCDQAEQITGLTGACSGTVGGQKPRHQVDTAFTGKNLTYFQRQTADQCEADCNGNPKCLGFTWIKPGTYNAGDPAMCYLMGEITGTSPSKGHTSGLRSNSSSSQSTGGGTSAGVPDMSGRWTVDWAASGCKPSFSLTKTGANSYSGNLDQCSSTGRKDPVTFIFGANGTAEMTLSLPNDGVRKFTVSYSSTSILYSNMTFRR